MPRGCCVTLNWGVAQYTGTPSLTSSFTTNVTFNPGPPNGTYPSLNSPLRATIVHTYFGQARGSTPNGTISTFNVGGIGQVGYYVRQQIGATGSTTPSANDYQTIQFTFSESVSNLRFSITDIDRVTRDFIDGVSLTSSSGFTAITDAGTDCAEAEQCKATQPHDVGPPAPHGDASEDDQGKCQPWKAIPRTDQADHQRGHRDERYEPQVGVRHPDPEGVHQGDRVVLDRRGCQFDTHLDHIPDDVQVQGHHCAASDVTASAVLLHSRRDEQAEHEGNRRHAEGIHPVIEQPESRFGGDQAFPLMPTVAWEKTTPMTAIPRYTSISA